MILCHVILTTTTETVPILQMRKLRPSEVKEGISPITFQALGLQLHVVCTHFLPAAPSPKGLHSSQSSALIPSQCMLWGPTLQYFISSNSAGRVCPSQRRLGGPQAGESGTGTCTGDESIALSHVPQVCPPYVGSIHICYLRETASCLNTGYWSKALRTFISIRSAQADFDIWLDSYDARRYRASISGQRWTLPGAWPVLDLVTFIISAVPHHTPSMEDHGVPDTLGALF